MFKYVAPIVVGILCVASTAAAQGGPPIGNAKAVVVSPKWVAPNDGPALYQAYCASCHGKDGKGFGPASRFTHVRPTDLTAISAEHPRASDCTLHVLTTLYEAHRSQTDNASDGKELDMPRWSTVISSISQDPGAGHMRMVNIANYVASLQQPVK